MIQTQYVFRKAVPEHDLRLLRSMTVSVRQKETQTRYKLTGHHGQCCCHTDQSRKRPKRNMYSLKNELIDIGANL